jgi:hypothetical protein
MMADDDLVAYSRRKPYKLASGDIVPSVTTVLSRYKAADRLMAWAWRQGKAGLDYNQTRGKAADAGTLTHTMAENWFRGHPQRLQLSADPDVMHRASTAFHGFLAWADGQRLRPAVIDGQQQIEVRMVSERYRFGGMMDAAHIGRDKRICLCDWKTSDGIYVDYLMQLAAYGALWDETHPDMPITGGYHLVRFDKESGGFVHHYWPALERVTENGEVVSCLDQFLRLLRCYQDEKVLSRLLK